MAYIDEQLFRFKTELEAAILAGGVKGKESIIRSSALINLIHDAVRLQELKDSSSNIARFIENAKRYSEIPELTAEILRIFIKRVEVGERVEKYSRTAPQEVRIYYRDIGLVDELPQSMADSVSEEIPNEVA